MQKGREQKEEHSCVILVFKKSFTDFLGDNH